MATGARKYWQPLVSRLVKPLVLFYLRKPRNFRYQNIKIKVENGIFHPGIFFSTKLILRYLDKFDLTNQKFLELGAGSGLISIWASLKGADVTCTDINPEAVKAAKENAERNQTVIQVLESDLFDSLPDFRYDWVVVNPPYYPRNPINMAEHAWYCGEDHLYFKRFFDGLVAYRHPQRQVIMVLSEDCDIKTITQIALAHHWEMEMVLPQQNWGEWSFVFALKFKKVQ